MLAVKCSGRRGIFSSVGLLLVNVKQRSRVCLSVCPTWRHRAYKLIQKPRVYINSDGSKTAKIIKRRYYPPSHRLNINAMWFWITSPFYDFCCFWSIAVNIADKLLFYIYICYFITDYSMFILHFQITVQNLAAIIESFNIWHVWLENGPKIRFLTIWPPKWGATPKRHIFA